MKKFFKMLFIALPMLAVMSSCSDDKDEVSLANSIKGTYPVGVAIAVAPATPTNVLITATGEETVTFMIEKFTVGAADVKIVAENIKLTGKKGDVALAYSGVVTTTPEIIPGATITMTLGGTAKAKVLDLALVVTVPGVGEIPVTVKSK